MLHCYYTCMNKLYEWYVNRQILDQQESARECMRVSERVNVPSFPLPVVLEQSIHL